EKQIHGAVLLTERSVECEDEADAEQVLRRRETRNGRPHVWLREEAAARATRIVDAVFDLDDRVGLPQGGLVLDRRRKRRDGLLGPDPATVAIPGEFRTYDEGPRSGDSPFHRRLRGHPQRTWITNGRHVLCAN